MENKEVTPYSVNQYVAHLFAQHLTGSAAAIDYLRGRGLDGATAKRYCLGFAPQAKPGFSLVNHLSPFKADFAAAREAGLFSQADNGSIRDRFSDRIMFPIRDTEGRFIGFGGRIHAKRNEIDTRPKYLNTQETALFKKRNHLYGLYEVLKAHNRTKIESLIVVEGYMDVVMMARHGITNAVASLGTAITREQIKLAFEHTNQLTFCFDGDNAGTGAAIKALSIIAPLIKYDREVKFAFLPSGEDPDSMVRKFGAAETRHVINTSSISFAEFLIESSRYSQPLNSNEAATMARQYIAGLPALSAMFSDNTKRPVDRKQDSYRSSILVEYNQAMGLPAEFIHPNLKSLVNKITLAEAAGISQNNESKEESRGENKPTLIQVAHYLATQHEGILIEAQDHPDWPQEFNLFEAINESTPISIPDYTINRKDALDKLVNIAVRLHHEDLSNQAKERALASLMQLA
jgi:DNA primase catalytic core